MKKNQTIAILGAGNIGVSIANGLVKSGKYAAKNIYLTRRKAELLGKFAEKGFQTTTNNREAVQAARLVILAVQPQQLNELLTEIKDVLKPGRHVVVSVASGATVKALKKYAGSGVAVVRAMPNTAIAIQESMTCISANEEDKAVLSEVQEMFNQLGQTLVIKEDLMIPATALCACGIAFFLRAIRAASQGGIEIGFHADEAITMAAQTAKGAAALLLSMGDHPENEVDKVTTPRGCTISGLNQMEHHGFSSSMIRGIVTSADKAARLYSDPQEA
ncbi:MAG: pyrroline-5-carboxylate reductase [Ignavibacteria bacterium]|nr:pyrroline-5-carboxylate reductase [Ignavibacteria bacterium]